MAYLAHFDSGGNLDFTCSATVVSVNVVLTAARCAIDGASGGVLDPSGFRVVTGAADWTDTAHRQVLGVSRVIVDSAYDASATTSDAALLVLSTPTSAPAIRLATSADPCLEQAGTGAVIAGWGDTYSGDPTFNMSFSGRRPCSSGPPTADSSCPASPICAPVRGEPPQRRHRHL